MPELPEVETVRRGLQPVMEGARFLEVEVRRPDLRFPFPRDFARRLRGHVVERLARRAKYLVADLSSGDALIMHLGMSGSFRVRTRKAEQAPGVFRHPRSEEQAPGVFRHPRSEDKAHDHVVFVMSSGASVVFNDPRRFGFMQLVPRAQFAQHPLAKNIGPEPLDAEFDAPTLAALCREKKTTLKTALSDQRVVAGLGNIYVCEALHRARLSPRRAAASLATRKGGPSERAQALVAAIKSVLIEAIEAGGSSLRDHRRTDGALGDFQLSFRVYDRAGERCPTPECRGIVRRVTQAGRSTYFCPVCQR